MRVDGLLIRMNDTRLYHEVKFNESPCFWEKQLVNFFFILQAGTNYLLREYSSKEAKISELKALNT